MKILILTTGCIATYKIPSICSALKNRYDHEVRILTTKKALDFVTKESILYSSEIMNDTYMAHIKATEWADKVVVVPATYNTINKIAAGIADNEVTSACAAIQKRTPKIMFPTMNTNMWEKKILQENLNKLLNWGWNIVEPVYGKLACDKVGKGALISTDKVVKWIGILKPTFSVIIKKELIDDGANVWYKDISSKPLEGLYINDDGFAVLNAYKIPRKYDRGTGSSYVVALHHCSIVYSKVDNYIDSPNII